MNARNCSVMQPDTACNYKVDVGVFVEFSSCEEPPGCNSTMMRSPKRSSVTENASSSTSVMSLSLQSGN